MTYLSENGGKRAGQSVKGCCAGPVRPKGGHNKATISGERVKREILAVWDKIDGPKLLAEWARENFGEFIRVILQIVPRQEISDVQAADNGVGLRLIFNRASEVLGDGDDDGDRFIDATAADDLPRLAAGLPSGPHGDDHTGPGQKGIRRQVDGYAHHHGQTRNG